MFDATVTAVAEKAKAKAEAWTQQDELLALNAELTHLVHVTLVAANGGKVPRPLRIPRPGSRAADPIVVMTHEQLFAASEEGR